MLHLIDANVLIRAHEDYYPIDRIPPFWEWLKSEAINGHVKMPAEICDEILDSNGLLRDWIAQSEIQDCLVLDEPVNADRLNHVLNHGYGEDLTEAELDQIGKDPFLMAYCLGNPARTVVTKEVSKPSKQRGHRRIPDVCNDLGIGWMDDFEFYRIRNLTII